MAVFSGPRSPFVALEDGTTGSFWSPRVLKSLWQDAAGTIPAVVDSEVKRMDDLGGLGNHMIAPSGSRTISDHTYNFKGPILRKDGNQLYLEFDGNGSSLTTASSNGNWPSVTGNNSLGITMAVAFETNPTQPALPSSGLSGTWLGSGSLGNFGGSWFFGLRLNQETMFYATVRNAENTAWIPQWNEGDRYSNLSSAQWLGRKILYIASGTINNNTFGVGEWIDTQETVNVNNIAFSDTSRLPVPFNNVLVIGARSPVNDNWIAGKFYGGAMIAKQISESERKIIEDFLSINLYL